MKRLIKFFKGYGKESIIAPVFKMLEAIFELFVPLVVAYIVDNGINGTNVDRRKIWIAGLIMLALAVIGLICAISAQFFAAKAAVGVSQTIRSTLYAKVQSLSYSQSDKIGVSTLITRLTSDVNTVQTGINLFLRLFMRSPFIVFGAMIMAFTIDVKLALIFALTIPLLSVIVFGIMLVNIPLYKRIQGRLDKVVGKTRSNYRGTRVIRAFNRQDKEIDDFDVSHKELTSLQLFTGRISALMNPLTYVIVNLAIIVLIKQGAIHVDSGTITQGQLIALYNYMTQILVELIKLANLIITLNKSMACVSRINNILDTEPTVLPPVSKETSQNGYAIEFDNVSFGYTNDGDEAINNISFGINAGETVGIIGGTGSGKSTLVNLIPGFYFPTSGNVFINGKNTAKWNSDDLRDEFGVVPQKPNLFMGTIRSNLQISNESATEADMWNALDIAQAGEFVRQKDGGLDAPVKQNGSNFSGGQKQRLTIARALVRKPQFLILDDSASALDYATEAKLRQEISMLDWNPTIFIVSQRASSVMTADKIIVLEDGSAVGIGSHNELLDSCEVYREIYSSQFGGESCEK